MIRGWRREDGRGREREQEGGREERWNAVREQEGGVLLMCGADDNLFDK